MANNTFVFGLKGAQDPLPDQNIFNTIFEEYGRVIFESLITSFGLDFFIKDRIGGDVDTVHNVRSMKDNKGHPVFKNPTYNSAYKNRGEYNPIAYHNEAQYRKKVSEARDAFSSTGAQIADAYVLGNPVIPRNNPTIPREHQGQLDHIIPAKKVHDDPGRILAGVKGVDLANAESNLAFTNAALNRNKSNMTTEEYIAWAEANPDLVNWNGQKGAPLPEDVKSEMHAKDRQARKAYDAQINSYYTSRAFWTDVRDAAAKRGFQMGIRQAMGFFLAEVVCTVREEIRKIPSGADLKKMLLAVGNGIKKGFENALKNGDMLIRFAEGAIAGSLSSLTTTISNIFFTTSENLGRCIRQMYAAVVQAAKVLFMNPDNLYFGERIKKTSIILATGASVVVGTNVASIVAKTPIGNMNEIGPYICTFSSVLVSGLLSCTLLIFMDRSKFMNAVVSRLNDIPSEANNFAEIADAFEALAIKMSNLDIQKFQKEIGQYDQIANSILKAETEEELNTVLHSAYKRMSISLPWQGDFDSFMGNKSNRLVFS